MTIHEDDHPGPKKEKLLNTYVINLLDRFKMDRSLLATGQNSGSTARRPSIPAPKAGRERAQGKGDRWENSGREPAWIRRLFLPDPGPAGRQRKSGSTRPVGRSLIEKRPSPLPLSHRERGFWTASQGWAWASPLDAPFCASICASWVGGT